MKAAVIVACVALGVAENQFEQFQNWKVEHGKIYADEESHSQRFECFKQTLATIESLNAKDTAKHGLNHFSDLCAAEFKKMYLSEFTPDQSGLEMAPPLSKAELMLADNSTAYDWRQHGAVNAVKNQGQCGSCWTFSAVATMEGAWFLAGHPLASLSEEQLVQCATGAGNGCQGGNMYPAIHYVMENGGIDSEKDYPYTSGNGVRGQCNMAKEKTYAAKIAKVLAVPRNEDTMAAYLLKYGPLSIAVDAESGWQTYRGGIRTRCALYARLDHGVALVGYGVEGSTRFWIVRNSWTAHWGEKGYIRLVRGKNCDGMNEMSTAAIGAK